MTSSSRTTIRILRSRRRSRSECGLPALSRCDESAALASLADVPGEIGGGSSGIGSAAFPFWTSIEWIGSAMDLSVRWSEPCEESVMMPFPASGRSLCVRR
ncbi:hypothetical protein CHELA1G2_12958 [Hyphomicrobiales bacterium]|nr:hypothetical protein CHELA1G2_12958 [Hyphomicrobiales bacterium]